MTMVERLVITMERIGGGGNYSMIYAQYRHIYHEEFGEYPEAKSKAWKASIRRVVESYSKDSKNYNGKYNYFRHLGVDMSGCWGLQPGVRFDEKTGSIMTEG